MAWVVPHPGAWMAGKRDRRPPDPEDIEIGRRLRAAREAQRRTQIEMGAELGISEATYGRRESGLIKFPIKDLLKVARILGLEPEAVLPGGPEPTPLPRPPQTILRELEAAIAHIEGRGAVVVAPPRVHGDATVTPLPGVERLEPVRVPVLRDAASVGSARTHADGDEVLYAPRPAEAGHRFVAVQVRGDCLEPSRIFSGHYAIVDLDATPRNGDTVLARRDDELLVKRIVFDPGIPSIRYLEADQHWDPLLIADGVEVLGVCRQFTYPPPRAP